MNLNENNYLFDTTVFDDFLRGRPIAQQIFSQVRLRNISISYSILTEAELWVGIQGSRTVREHEDLLRLFQRRYINVTIARRAGELRRQLHGVRHQRIPGMVDCIIAATGEYYGLPVCTRNTKDFSLLSDLGIAVFQYIV
jgi:predicted nucleic acid-binding protein